MTDKTDSAALWSVYCCENNRGKPWLLTWAGVPIAKFYANRHDENLRAGIVGALNRTDSAAPDRVGVTDAARGALASIIGDPDCCAASKAIARDGLTYHANSANVDDTSCVQGKGKSYDR